MQYLDIIGVGTDLVELERVALALRRSGPGLVAELCGAEELAEAGPRAGRLPFVAGRIAAKEAVAKALGTGLAGFHWREIVIAQAPNGQPRVRLVGRAERVARARGVRRCLVSIAHSAHMASAHAVALGESDERRAFADG